MTDEALFELALKTPEAARGELLDRECAGNAELRARIEARLADESADQPTTPDVEGTLLAGKSKLLEEIGSRIKKGLAYREVLAGLLLAGVRNVQPRPSVGFKFHAVLVVNSAHLASSRPSLI